MDWIYARLLAISKRLWPQLENMRIDRQLVGVAELTAFLYSAPLALWGIVWLIRSTDLDVIRTNAGVMIVMLLLNGIFLRLRFFFIVELRENRYGSSDGSMAGIVLWSAIFLFGPSALWVSIIWYLLQGLVILRRRTGPAESWILRRNLSMSLASESLVPLLAIQLYTARGGVFGLNAIGYESFGIALLAVFSYALLYLLFWLPYVLYSIWVQKRLDQNNPLRPLFTFFFLSIGVPQLVLPFAILGAEIFGRDGIGVFLFYMSGIMVVATLTRRLSLVGETNRFQYRALEKLEQFSRAILNAPATLSALEDTLQDRIPNMFPSGKIIVWRFPDQILFNSRPDWSPELNAIWPWLLEQQDVSSYLARERPPWLEEDGPHNPLIIAPILDKEGEQAYGGVFLELHTLAQPWNRRTINNLVPAVKTLADQVASAFNRLDLAEQSLDLDRVTQELRLAGSIQSSLLPFTFPAIPGWQLAVSLTPAGAMAGDFFDIIPLSDGRIGIVIADVLDKGLGPALYMALSRTLIRTYATEFDLDPSTVLFATNERILKDTQANLFVTTFYGVLDPETGELTYSNAGHNPPYLLELDGDNQKTVVSLNRTGIPIGIDEDATWKHESVQINPGACLLLYTDGIPEAENGSGEFFEADVLVEVAKKSLGRPAEEMQSMVLKRVYEFLGDAPPSDDMTLMVLTRDN
ncbi:MAG: SpoIIE family protein phosphatase [Anaerolineae bacterium]|nr:SpoIIE family protein phosphatase [Anaerolineae bacterium]